jgi:hypothetical protein
MVDWVKRIGEFRVERKPIQGGAPMPTVRGVGLHATDGFDVDSAHAHQAASGFGVHFYVGEHRIIQARPLNITGGGFRNNADDPGDPNAGGLIQIEAVDRLSMPGGHGLHLHLPEDGTLEPLVALARFLHDTFGIPYARPKAWPDDLRDDSPDTPNGAWAAENYRRRTNVFARFQGWLGHIEAPDQDPTWHWDPGSFDYARLFELSKGVDTPMTPEEREAFTSLQAKVRGLEEGILGEEPPPETAHPDRIRGYRLAKRLIRQTRPLEPVGVSSELPHIHDVSVGPTVPLQ